MNKYKKIIEEEKESARYKRKLIKQIIDESKPKRKKDLDKKEVYKLPMPSHDNVISNRAVDIKTYGAIMLNSNWGGKILNPKDRYIYDETINKQIDKISTDCNISKRTLKRHIAKLRKCDINILEPITVNGELAYKLNYSCDEGMNFVTIDNVALRKLCNAYSENSLRLYIIFNYMCIEILQNINSKEYIVNTKETHITQEWLCKKIGIKYSNRIVITDCVEALTKGGFINVRKEYKLNPVKNESGEVTLHKVPYYYYSLSDEYLESTRS